MMNSEDVAWEMEERILTPVFFSFLFFKKLVLVGMNLQVIEFI